MLMEIALPKMGELWVMMMTMISPSGREVPPAESLRQRAKVLLSKFRHEAAALRPESPLLIFSRSKQPIYHKMGTGGGPRGAQTTRARLGSLACPGGLCSPRSTRQVLLRPIGCLLVQKTTKSFAAFGLRLVLISCNVKNMQKLTTGTWHYVNRLVPKMI